MHNPDGTRTICTGTNLDNCRTIGGNIVKEWWGDKPETNGPYPPITAMNLAASSEKPIWEEPTLHEYPIFNSYTGAMHNLDGSRTICSGKVLENGNEDCKTVGGNIIKNMWGGDPKTNGPYPPSLVQKQFNETYNSFDGSTHENDGSRTVNGRRVTDKNQIKLNFGTDH